MIANSVGKTIVTAALEMLCLFSDEASDMVALGTEKLVAVKLKLERGVGVFGATSRGRLWAVE